jgi:hypothetical protein
VQEAIERIRKEEADVWRQGIKMADNPERLGSTEGGIE